MTIIINVSSLFKNRAKIKSLDRYLMRVSKMAGEGNEVILHGPAPIWLYLKLAHFLHGKARRLIYRSPVIGDLVIFDHDPN